MRKATGPMALLLASIVLSALPAFGGGPPSGAGNLYNHHVTVDRYLGAKNLSDRPPAIPNSNPSAASPRWLTPGGYPIPHGQSYSNGRGAGAWGSRASARAHYDDSRLPVALGFDPRFRWPLGLQPFDRPTRRSLEKVIEALD